MTKRTIAYWVIPPEENAEFVAGKEEVLETYTRPYDPWMGELAELNAELAAWSAKRNASQRGVKWQFQIDHALNRPTVSKK